MKSLVSSSSSRIRSALVQYGGLLSVVAVLALFPLMGPSNKDLSLATSALIFGVAATGLGFLWGQVGEVNIAHAAVFGVGAYTAGIAAQDHGIDFVPSLVLSLIAGAIAAFIVALPSLRTRGHYFVILTFAIGQVAVVVATRLDDLTGGVDGLTVIPAKQEVVGLRLTDRQDFYYICICVAAVILTALLLLTRSRWGATLRGIRENEQLAAAVGTPVVRHRILAFTVSGAVGGLAGQLHLYNVKFVDPGAFNVQASIFFLLMVLLGGRRYLLGPIVGAAVYTFLPEFIFLDPGRSRMLLGLILVAMILLLPQGLLSLPSRIAALRANRAGSRSVAQADRVDEVDPPTGTGTGASPLEPPHEVVEAPS
ncbi:MAG: branched-chain amino acid transport system permease protein [Acidimicrobiaceae bacterium]